MSTNRHSATSKRIAEQRTVVASLTDGTPQHRIASQILLMLEQVHETEQAIAALKERKDASR